MKGYGADCHVTILGAGPYGLAAAAYLREGGIETRIFGESMSFWQNQMPVGMFLRSHPLASDIAAPGRKLSLGDFCREQGDKVLKPVPLQCFVDYGHWFQRHAAPHLESKKVTCIELHRLGFRVGLADEEQFITRRVLVAAGISAFAALPSQFDGLPVELASHTSRHSDLRVFKGQRVAVIGCGQSALESSALLKEAGIEVELIARRKHLRWVGLHPKLHHLGLISWILYSDRDVGPAGLSRLIAMPRVFKKFPREFQNRASYRAIRPAGAGWLQDRIAGIPMALGRNVVAVQANGCLHLKLDDGTQRKVDHALLATGFRVDIRKHKFLSTEIVNRLKVVNGYPVLSPGLESSVPGLHFLGKPAAWSFGPLLGFVSGSEFASQELIRFISRNDRP